MGEDEAHDATDPVPGPAVVGAQTLLRDEFSQAWQHYRHLEILRNQYLTYALSITLASLAVSVSLSGTVARSPGRVIIAGTFVWVYSIFIGFACIGVFKVRHLNLHYNQVWRSVRDYFYVPAGPNLEFDIPKLSRRGYGNSLMFSRMLDIQTWAEGILSLLLLLASGASIGLLGLLIATDPAWWHVVFMSVIDVTVVSLCAVCLAILIKLNRSIGDTMPD